MEYLYIGLMIGIGLALVPLLPTLIMLALTFLGILAVLIIEVTHCLVHFLKKLLKRS